MAKRVSLSDIAAEIDDRLENTAFRIGDRLRKVREARGLTRAEFGERVGLSTDRIQKYENGIRKPKMEMVRAFADVLEVSPLALIEPTPSSVTNTMFVLFALEEFYGMKLGQDGDDMCLKFDKSTVLHSALEEWFRVKNELAEKEARAGTVGEVKEIQEAYGDWKWNYPKYVSSDTISERRKLLEDQLLAIQRELQELDDK